jgi:Mor family transcriptional regulator
VRYIKAEDVLPWELITQIQQYVDGVTIYIPRKAENRRPWGDGTRYRGELDERNACIRREYAEGAPVPQLARYYHLSEKSIRRILRKP